MGSLPQHSRPFQQSLQVQRETWVGRGTVYLFFKASQRTFWPALEMLGLRATGHEGEQVASGDQPHSHGATASNVMNRKGFVVLPDSD